MTSSTYSSWINLGVFFICNNSTSYTREILLKFRSSFSSTKYTNLGAISTPKTLNEIVPKESMVFSMRLCFGCFFTSIFFLYFWYIDIAHYDTFVTSYNLYLSMLDISTYSDILIFFLCSKQNQNTVSETNIFISKIFIISNYTLSQILLYTK